MKFLLALLILLAPLSASAQSFLQDNLQLPGAAGAIQDQLSGQGAGPGVSVINQYDQKYKGGAAQSAGGQESLIGTDNYNLFFVRHPSDSDGIVTLRIESPVSVQGCATVTFPPATMQMRGIEMLITVQDPKIAMDKSIRYPHLQCNGSGGVPKLDIEISRDSLRDNDIRHITLESSSGKQKFELHISDSSISLSPATPGPFTLSGGTHHFYDSRTVLLQAPAIGDDPALPGKIQAIADKHNLRPAESGYRQGNSFYFIDTTKSLSIRLRLEETIKLDTIEIDDIFMGAEGPYTVKRKIDVFASRPGAFD